MLKYTLASLALISTLSADTDVFMSLDFSLSIVNGDESSVYMQSFTVKPRIKNDLFIYGTFGYADKRQDSVYATCKDGSPTWCRYGDAVDNSLQGTYLEGGISLRFIDRPNYYWSLDLGYRSIIDQETEETVANPHYFDGTVGAINVGGYLTPTWGVHSKLGLSYGVGLFYQVGLEFRF